MQDNAFFQEPPTQKKLLDILFIYSKLHPDIGYRQGMHELLAPILWVVHCDAIEASTIPNSEAEDDLMLEVLDERFIEHDAFTLFCAVMQTAKSFYEIGDSTSPIVDRSRRIHDEYLGEVDPELANHLQVIQILPQIFLLRWIRLLFGREFSLADTLSVWDVLFAEGLSLSLVDMTCLAMLLRIRWPLLRADHTEALQLLLHYEPPTPPHGPATLVQDAIFLERNRTFEGGTYLISRYSGLEAALPEQQLPPVKRPPALQLNQRHKKNLNTHSRSSGSPGRSPARFLSPQKGLESLFQEVSGSLQKRTEGWNISKTVRAAAGEVRRNVNNFHAEAKSPRNSLDITPVPPPQESTEQDANEGLRNRLSMFEKRNKALARMLADALEELRSQKESSIREQATVAESSFNIALAKMQFVQVYLADCEIPIPGQEALVNECSHESQPRMTEMNHSGRGLLPEDPDELAGVTEQENAASNRPSTSLKATSGNADSSSRDEGADAKAIIQVEEPHKANVETSKLSSPKPRPPLAQSPLSWILGEGQHRSDFVSSSTPPPEQRRDSIPKVKPKRLFPDVKDSEGRNGSESEDDGFTMSSLHGSRARN
ncbi:hypothetical protein GJ744_006208 [Endocarpon pusillum]|uniref:Rab-GAP TBC domain-containing protein n=1 Tax=Endocarpon pusillum TaxID=364733 RepID=A0A8H7E8B0_9EURO|nr:hypothetical protein GJ744_006208 [Endocarpon pusillum]